MSILNEHVLVLNKQWSPVDTCTVRNAYSKLFGGTARFLDVETYTLHDLEAWLELPVGENDRWLLCQATKLKVPDVMILQSSITPKRRTMQFSRKNLARRDNHECQYCGDHNDLTIDHIMPVTRSGKSTWLNCVMACLSCNAKKSNKTPDEAQMPLRTRPYEPAWSPVFRVSPTKFLESWSKFLPESVVSASKN